jgi:hypothetical protein
MHGGSKFKLNQPIGFYAGNLDLKFGLQYEVAN